MVAQLGVIVGMPVVDEVRDDVLVVTTGTDVEVAVGRVAAGWHIWKYWFSDTHVHQGVYAQQLGPMKPCPPH